MNNINKILIADDHPLVREGLNTVLSMQDKINVELFFCKNGVEVLDLISKNKFDLLLLDISMPILDGLEALDKIRNQIKSELPVLMMTSHDDQKYVNQSIELGASGYFMKYEDADVLIDAIIKVLNREKFYSEQINYIINNSPNAHLKSSINELSKHQKQILSLIVQEKTSQQIADELFLSIRTIEGHRKRLMDKLNLNSTIGLVKYALKNGLE